MALSHRTTCGKLSEETPEPANTQPRSTVWAEWLTHHSFSSHRHGRPPRGHRDRRSYTSHPGSTRRAIFATRWKMSSNTYEHSIYAERNNENFRFTCHSRKNPAVFYWGRTNLRDLKRSLSPFLPPPVIFQLITFFFIWPAQFCWVAWGILFSELFLYLFLSPFNYCNRIFRTWQAGGMNSYNVRFMSLWQVT